MNKKDFLRLLDRYLAGKTSEIENEALFNVYEQIETSSEYDIADEPGVDEYERTMLQRFKATVQSSDENGTGVFISNKKNFSLALRPYYIAASILIFITIGCYLFLRESVKSADPSVFRDDETRELVTFVNESSLSKKIFFADSSFVILNSGSRIVYNRRFNGNLRKVYLDGTGFFQVTKNKFKPFIVFTDRIVTKVLGTSFIINGDAKSPAKVTVVTGRVAVFKKESFHEKDMQANLKGGLLLTPNHQITLIAGNKFSQGIAAQPHVVNLNEKIAFSYDNTPVASVFENLQTAYNIEIVYDHRKLRNCTLTVDIGKEDFQTKLNLICRTLNLEYHQEEGKVFISGDGCNH